MAEINEDLLREYYQKQGEINFNQQLYCNENPYRKEFHLARKRAVLRIVNKVYNPSGKILDAGCGDGEYIKHFSNKGHSYGLDISSSFIEHAKNRDNNTEFIVGSIEKMPYKDKCFDVVLCSEALEHVLHYPEALSELCRVGNKVVISVPIEKTHPLIRFGLWVLGKKDMIPSEVGEGKQFEQLKGGHLREFCQDCLDYGLKKRGFNIIKRHKVHGSALIAVFFIVSEKLKFLQKLDWLFLPFIKLADCFSPWGLTYVVVATRGESDG